MIVGLAALAAVVLATGCATEKTHVLREGEVAEDTAATSENDIRYLVKQFITGIDRASERYKKEGKRRIVNVKPTTIDTTSRGSQAGYLAETISTCFQEELMESGMFIVYNEEMARAAAAAGRSVPYVPEFVMTSKLREQNVRRDNGNYYKEFSLLVRLTTPEGLDFWQKRIPIQKAVDKSNVR